MCETETSVSSMPADEVCDTILLVFDKTSLIGTNTNKTSTLFTNSQILQKRSVKSCVCQSSQLEQDEVREGVA